MQHQIRTTRLIRIPWHLSAMANSPLKIYQLISGERKASATDV